MVGSKLYAIPKARRGAAETSANSTLREMLVLESVSKQYVPDDPSTLALSGVNLRVEEGEFVSLIGRSGCGKTTLLNMAGALDFPTSGRVFIDGQDTSLLDDEGLTRTRRDQIGFVFQFFQLLPSLTAAENVELPIQLAGRTNVRHQALEKLDLVEMGSYAERYPHQLSGGQMQRVAIARAIVHEPKLVLADEPIGNLDSTSGQIVMELLRRIAVEMNTAVVMATHSLEAAEVGTSIVELRDGRVREIQRL